MHLYRTNAGPVAVKDNNHFSIDADWNSLINNDELVEYLENTIKSGKHNPELIAQVENPLKPIETQEVWAAGVTYFRSKTARMEESQEAGGGDFYDRVYAAERPEIFFKATPSRTVGPNENMAIRDDSKWIVPEPELTLVISRSGKILGYTVGNDLSCRDIEGENPLYLPQAKTFDRCAAVGPCILVSRESPIPETEIRLRIFDGAGRLLNEASTTLAQMKRALDELVKFLFRHNEHPNGVLLMTGTGIVPPDDFCLQAGHRVEITIDGIGTLNNVMG